MIVNDRVCIRNVYDKNNKLIFEKDKTYVTSDIKEDNNGKLYLIVIGSDWIIADANDFKLVKRNSYNSIMPDTFDPINLEYLNNQLKYSAKFGLLTEVIATAMDYLKSKPKASVRDAISYGISEWIK